MKNNAPIPAKGNRLNAMLAGLFLAKFNRRGLRALGFQTYAEFYNVIGLALGIKPSSIKNYCDEFAPRFPGGRSGWHKREMRPDRVALCDLYGETRLPEMADMVRRSVYAHPLTDMLLEDAKHDEGGESSFAKRLITGQAAEQYFAVHYREFRQFAELRLQDATRWGCGFDFRLHSENIEYGVEVKGIASASGAVVMTDKERHVAEKMKTNYFLFVVKNIRESPAGVVYRNPFNSDLRFKAARQLIARTQWTTTIR